MRRVVYGIRCLYGNPLHTTYQQCRNNCILTSPSRREVSQLSKHSTRISKSVTKHETKLDSDQESDADFLTRAQQYGITTIAHLDRECLSFLTKKLHLDQAETRPFHSNLHFWKLLLDYGIRTHGLVGARSVWQGLRFAPRVNLNSDDDLVTAMWLKLLHIAVRNEDLAFLDLLLERNGIVWKRPRLLSEVVSSLLRQGLETDAVIMCYRLQEKHKDQDFNMLDLFMTYQPRGHNDFRRLFLVFDHVRPGKMYVKAIRHLWQEGRSEDAFILHKLLILKGDFPASFLDLQPFLVHLARMSQDPGPFIRQLAAAGAGYAGQARITYELEQQHQNAMRDGVTNSEAYTSTGMQNKVSDFVAAKAFAARGLSFEFVLNSLRAFGLTEIGPQTIREIGVAAGDLDTFARRLATLDHYEVDTGGSAYSRIVRKLCIAKERGLLKQALQTDMHHDVFEDSKLQRRLLTDKTLKCEWPEVNLLLTMLNHGDVGVLKSHVNVALLAPLGTNILEQRVFLGASERNPTFRTVQDPLSHILIVERMLRELCDGQSQRKTQKQRLDRIRFIAGYMQDCVANGTAFHYFHWRHILLQLGANHSLKEVYSLTLWISNRVTSSYRTPTVISSHDRPTQILNTLFNFQFQIALMNWSLKDLFSNTSSKSSQEWRRSLYLLKILEDGYHVNVNLPTLRKIVVHRCVHLRRSSAASRVGIQTFSSMAKARRMCSDILERMHELWSTSPAMRQEELRVASRMLKVRQGQHRRSSSHLMRSKRSQPLPRERKEQSGSMKERSDKIR